MKAFYQNNKGQFANIMESKCKDNSAAMCKVAIKYFQRFFNSNNGRHHRSANIGHANDFIGPIAGIRYSHIHMMDRGDGHPGCDEFWFLPGKQ